MHIVSHRADDRGEDCDGNGHGDDYGGGDDHCHVYSFEDFCLTTVVLSSSKSAMHHSVA